MTDTKPFGDYGFAIFRTFWIKGSDLKVSRRWQKQEQEQATHSDQGNGLSTSIIGTAISELDSVCVIGKEDRETKEFSLTIKSDAFAKQEWEWIRRNEEVAIRNDGTTAKLRVRAHSFENLSKNPPTATLFVVDDDREIGIKGGWSIECAVPPSVLVQLETDLLARRTGGLYLGFDWESGLVRHKHAPLSFPNTWGLFTVEGYAEPLRGHVKLIG